MSKSKTFENDLLKLIFQGIPIAGIADNAASGPRTSRYLALHTADPGETGDQSTSEVAYTGYARIPVARSPSGWTVAANVVSPVASVEFGEMTAGTAGTATHASIGVSLTGAGKILYRGALNPSIAYAVGVITRIKNSSTITED